MSYKVNLRALPPFVLTADNPRMIRRTSGGNSLSALTFPKSKSSLWDPSPTGDVVGLHLCYYRNPHLRVLEKALRLAHRHAQQRNTPSCCCFLLGSVSVDEDEEGVTLTLDRFDPGQAQSGKRVPSLLLPGDVVVPVEFVLHGDSEPNPAFRQSDLSITFKALQQACSGGEAVDLSQLLGVRGQVICSQQGDQLGFSLRWSAASCASSFDVVGVRPLPIIPTALARSLSSRDSPHRSLKHQRGFLTMDQTRKLLLLLESDPKARSLPLVGVWVSGVVQPSHPQVWAWCLRFFHSSSLHDRVLSEQGWFLLVVFSVVSSHAQFYQCRPAGKQSGHMDYLLLSCSQDVTLFKHVEPAEGHYLRCDLNVDETTQTDLLGAPTPAAAANPVPSRLGATVDQDSGVEDEDLSPRPSPNPHTPTQQMRRVQPSVPELSLLLDSSLPPSHLPPTPQPCTSARSSHTPKLGTSSMGSHAPQPCTSSRSSLSPQPSTSSRGSHAPPQPCTSSRSSLSPQPSTSSRGSHAPPQPCTSSRSSHSPQPCTSSRNSHTPQPSTSSSTSSHSPQNEPSLAGHRYLHSTPSAPLGQSSCGGFWTGHTPPTLILPSAQPSPECTSAAPRHGNGCTQSSPHAHAHAHPGALQPTSRSPPRPCSCLQPGPLPWTEGGAGALPSDAYQMLMAQERQLRLLQAQIQMLLETQVRPQAVHVQTDGQTLCRQTNGHLSSPTTQRPTTASVAVETGASLCWRSTLSPPTTLGRDGREDQPSSPLNTSTQELRASGVESPVLGESASMFFNTSATQPDPQDVLPALQLQVSNRLQATLNNQETPAHSSSSSSSSSLSSSYTDHARSYRKQEVHGRSYRRQDVSVDDDEEQLGVSLDPGPDPSTGQEASPVACNNPVLPPSLAQTSRHPLLPGNLSPAQTTRHPLLPGNLSPAQTTRHSLLPGDLSPVQTTRHRLRPGGSVDLNLAQSQTPRHPLLPVDLSLANTPRDHLCPGGSVDLSLANTPRDHLRPGGSVDLSLEANAIALRYLSDSQLSRLSVGSRSSKAALGSPERNFLSPSNMSLATRGYMRRHGLIEEEEDEQEEEEEEEEEEEGLPCSTLKTESSLPQSQLIRDLQPKLRLLAQSSRNHNKENHDKENHDKNHNKENRPVLQRPSLAAGSVGNFLDVGRLRQLPKLF